MTDLEKQIEWFKEYGVTNYIIENDRIVIKEFLLLGLSDYDKDFLKDTTIYGFLQFVRLSTCDKDFLKGTIIYGNLEFDKLNSCDKDFLQNTTIYGDLYLPSLTFCPKNFLKNTIIKGKVDAKYMISNRWDDFLDEIIDKIPHSNSSMLDNFLNKVHDSMENNGGRGFSIYNLIALFILYIVLFPLSVLNRIAKLFRRK